MILDLPERIRVESRGLVLLAVKHVVVGVEFDWSQDSIRLAVVRPPDRARFIFNQCPLLLLPEAEPGPDRRCEQQNRVEESADDDPGDCPAGEPAGRRGVGALVDVTLHYIKSKNAILSI